MKLLKSKRVTLRLNTNTTYVDHNMFNRFMLAALVVVGGVNGSYALEYFVDQKHSDARDDNPGTEAKPFKTIQPAVDKAKAGDIIWVKAGFYADKVKIDSQGRRGVPITLAAWKDDRVCIGSQPLALPDKASWTKIAGTKSWQCTLPEGTPDDIIVLYDGKAQPCQYTNTPPKDDQVLWSTYDQKTHSLKANAGGPNPMERCHLTMIRNGWDYVGLGLDSANWIIRGFEFGYASTFIYNFGYNNIIEDCYFHHAYFRALFGTGYLSTVRRCTFDDAAFHGGPGAGTLFEDNIFYRGDRAWDEYPENRIRNYQEGSAGLMFKGFGYAETFRHNFFDDVGPGLDVNGTGIRFYGNAFHDTSGSGIYNEYGINDTVIIGNYMGNCQGGVVSSYSSRMNVIDNFIEGPGSGVVWHNRDHWPQQNSYMMMRGNAIVGSPLPISGYGPAYDRFPEGWSNCLVDFNHYRLKTENGLMLDFNGKLRCKTIEELREKLGWDIHGEAKPYDPEHNDLTPESLGGGTVTVRLPIGHNGWKSRPMLSDPGITGKWPALPRFVHGSLPSFFWRVADGNGDSRPLYRGGTEYSWEDLWWPDSGEGYGEGEVQGCAWYVSADPTPEQINVSEWNVADGSTGNHFLLVSGKTPEKMLPQGAGWWTPVLPTAPGAVIDVSFKIRGLNLEPAGEDGGPAVFMRFTSLTGQKQSRVFMVGRDEAGEAHNAAVGKGSYAWTEIKQTITAPKEAGHVALFLALRPCKGKVNFDDINIKTRPGEMPESVMKKDAPPPRLPLQRFRETFFVDLAPFVNRSFADDEANNGIGGWSDQGPNCDMREFETGLRKFGGVPFNILPDKSLVVLKSMWRNPGNLPEKVVIPVGRPADTLFFLHAEAWGGTDDDFRYIIHYADGKDVTLPVNRKNAPGWANSRRTNFPAEEGTLTVVAEVVPTPQFVEGYMYRMEWNSPADRRGVKIASIEFSGSPGCVPILAGITGVLEW